jgi:hypothetical protein
VYLVCIGIAFRSINAGNDFIVFGEPLETIVIVADELQTNETDDRGRMYLGTEYANKRVTVAIVDVESVYPEEDELAAAYQGASESASELAEEWAGVSDEAWDRLDE